MRVPLVIQEERQWMDTHPSADEIAARSAPPTWGHIDPVDVTMTTCLEAPNFHCHVNPGPEGHHLHCNECHQRWGKHIRPAPDP